MPTNQEFTTWPKDDYSRHNDTLFQVQFIDGNEGDPWKTKSGYFRLIHVPTRVALWTHNTPLPDWAYKQQEVNGDKNLNQKGNVWFIDEIVLGGTSLPSESCYEY